MWLKKWNLNECGISFAVQVGKSGLIVYNSSKGPLTRAMWRHFKKILGFLLDVVFPGTFIHLHINLLAFYCLSIPTLFWDARLGLFSLLVIGYIKRRVQCVYS